MPVQFREVNLPTALGGRPYGADRAFSVHARKLRERMFRRGAAFTAAWNAAGYERARTPREAEAAVEWARLSPNVTPAVRRAARELSESITDYMRAGRKAGAL